MSEGQIVVLTGGVGGAKLVKGLCHAGFAETVTAIVNVGDDFDHVGLRVTPDIDTLLYTLSGKSNVEQGWGRAGETWSFLEALASLGGEDWFRLGDGDLALHVLRTARLRGGEGLSAIIGDFARAWSIDARVLPASEDAAPTLVDTDIGCLSFQDYFVRHRCAPSVTAIDLGAAEAAQAGPGVAEALLDERTRAILIAPSNPWLSVDPILAIPDIRRALSESRAPVVAVSPLVGGTAVKGPTAKIMAELGLVTSNAAIAAHYAGLIDGLVVDSGDADPDLPVATLATPTLMTGRAEKVALAQAAVAFADRLRG